MSSKTHPGVTGRKSGSAGADGSAPKAQAPPPRSTAERDAYTVPEFCARHRISTGTYYNLKKRNLGPREGWALGRALITKEAAAEWRAKLPTEPVEETAA